MSNDELKIESDNDQDRAECDGWWGRHTEQQRIKVWRAIQSQTDDPDPVKRLVARFAQLAFAEAMTRNTKGKK